MTPESQQAAFNLRHWRNILQDRNVEVQTVAEVLAAGSGSVNLLAVLEAAENLLTPAPVDVSHAAQIEALSESLRSAMAYIADKNGFNQNGRRGDEALTSVASHNGYRFNYSDADFLLNALRAHPAGGVSALPDENVIGSVALDANREFDREGWKLKDCKKPRTEFVGEAIVAHHRAAGIGAGVVRFPRCTGPTHGGMIDLSSPAALAVARVLKDRYGEAFKLDHAEEILRGIEDSLAAAPSHEKE